MKKAIIKGTIVSIVFIVTLLVVSSIMNKGTGESGEEQAEG